MNNEKRLWAALNELRHAYVELAIALSESYDLVETFPSQAGLGARVTKLLEETKPKE